MTVCQQAEQTFSVGTQILTAHVRRVLSENKSYRTPRESGSPAVFTTKVKPYIPGFDWFILGTKMTVSLQVDSQTTRVVVKTTSQPYIIGDAFAMYERYIRDFFARLDRCIHGADDTSDFNETLLFQPSHNYLSLAVNLGVVLIFTALLIYIFIQHSAIFLTLAALPFLFWLISASAFIQTPRALRDHK